MYDVAIIGSGPAGVSAALSLKAVDKSFIWLSSRAVSKKVERAEMIKNYPGLPDVSGAELGKSFYNHCKSVGAEPVEELVTGVYRTGGHFTLLANDRQYEAKSVILCTGVETAKPLDGEEEFVGRGVSYCAVCDGFLYKGKNIAILCTDKKFEHEIEYLCNIAKTAYVIPLYRGYEIKPDNANIILKAPVKLSGDLRLKKIEFKDQTIEVDGMFILKGSLSPSTLVHGLRTEEGHIVVNRDCSTNIDGIFAAGDCTGRPYQYVKAAGEGNVSAHSAIDYLAKLKQLN